MAAVTQKMTIAELRVTGMKILHDALGHDNTEEFLKLCRGTPGWDFTKWLDEQPDPDPKEFEAELLKIQAERKARREAEAAQAAR